MEGVYALILAAGEGKRMHSQTSKVLHPVCGKALLDYVLDAAGFVCGEKPVVVAGSKKEQVIDHVGQRAEIVLQEQQLGTGHAVLCAKTLFVDKAGTLVVLCGDTPLITGETLERAIAFHKENGCGATVLTACVENPYGYGRIVKDDLGDFVRIVEQKDASVQENQIREINSGMYIFEISRLFAALEKVGNQNAQQEYYLTDTLEILVSEGDKVSTYEIDDEAEIMGINDRVALGRAEKVMQQRICLFHMQSGVTIISPENTVIGGDVTIEPDTVIHPFTALRGKCVIGANVTIGQGCTIQDSEIGDGSNVLHAVITDSIVGKHTVVGPFAYLRPGSVIGDHVKIGDFVEVKKSTIDDGTKISHLTYVGDSIVGKNVNFGCGTVTVNYDGKDKFETIIGDGAFIGCNTNLVAPIHVGESAYIAAGSTITEDVPDKALAIARNRQAIKQDWADKRGGKK